MARILCIGIATLDIVNEVASYPHEDEEIRILSQEKHRGGNATNTAVILSRLGHQCNWAGTLVDSLADKSDSQTILNDLKHNQINYDHCLFMPHGKVPTSYITLCRDTGSRTICHYRDLPEYNFQAFKKINLHTFNWLHFEGRNIDQTRQMMAYSKKHYPDIPISIEIEKPRDGIESLIQYAKTILFSRHYAQAKGYNDAKSFCQSISQQYPETTIVCAWGDSGAGASFNQKFYWQDAEKIQAVDTLGAGDVFNAGIIDHQLKQFNIQNCLIYACQLAASKCAQKGLLYSHIIK